MTRKKKEEPTGGSGVGVAYPSGDTAFKALLSARFCAAIWSHVTDCDETFNYWEPSHYLLFGKGFQTWEYSPEYALRSYAYILVHVLPAWIYHNLLQPNRLLVFYFSRCLLGLLSALCEVYFYKSVCREFGIHVGRIMLVIQLFSAGMFISSTAFLPSSFSMYMTLISLGAWYRRRYELAIFTTALSAFLSWPFAALIGLPIAIDMLFRRGEWMKFVQWSVISAVAILLPMLRIDSLYYGKLVVAPMNIVIYNVFTSHGPDLYGTESWTYYLYNGLLNFNFAFLAALLTPVALGLVQLLIPLRIRHAVCIPYWLSLAPLYIWLAVFWIQPHKEERFLFPVYPLICLCGAITLDAGQKLWFRLVVRSGVHYLQHTTMVIIPALVVVCVLGLMRIFVLYKGYHAPMDIFMELNKLAAEEVISEDQPLNICIGKEWYRFPSSFFLPSDNWNLRFLKSEFKGQLPQPYSSLDNATMVLPQHMNDMNKEEPSRYVNESICHFLVDLDRGPNSGTEFEPNYSEDTSKWTIIKSVPFMDATNFPAVISMCLDQFKQLSRVKPRNLASFSSSAIRSLLLTNRWLRLFYVPFLWESNCVFNNYNLLKAVKPPAVSHHQFVTSSL